MKMDEKQYPTDKPELYALLTQQITALMGEERHPVSNMANAAALLYAALPDINWAGFYFMSTNYLLLGPFQGNVACLRIPMGKGVCGYAAMQDEVQVIGDVHSFPGHIACDSTSKAELVIPLHHKNKVIGVLDIDSPTIERFDDTDVNALKKIALIIENACDWCLLCN